MKQIWIISIAGLFLTGCSGVQSVVREHEYQVLRSYVDHDIREVIRYYGLVDYAYDNAKGQRVFVWQAKRPYVMPPPTVKEQRRRTYGFSPWFEPQVALPHSNPYEMICIYKFASRYYHDRNAWMVEEFMEPDPKCRDLRINPE